MTKKQIGTLAAMCGMAGASVGVCMNTAGVFYTAIAEALHCGRGAVSLMSTITLLTAAFVSLYIEKIVKKLGLKKTVVLASLIVTGGTAGLSASQNLFMLYLWSFIRGIGCGMAQFVLVTLVLNRWFYAGIGLCTGIAMAFSGVPGVFLSNLFASITSARGWRMGILSSALAAFILCLPALLLPLSLYPEDLGEKPYGWEAYQKAKADRETPERSSSFHYGNKTFVLVLTGAVLIYFTVALSQHMPSYAETLGKDASVGAMMLSAVMAMNILSKLLFGALADRIGTLKTMLGMSAAAVLGLAGLILALNNGMLILSAGLFAWSFPVSAIGVSLACAELFGRENYGHTYPLINMIAGAVNAAAASLTGFVYDISGSYVPDFVISIVFLIGTCVCFILAYRSEKFSEI